MTSETVDATIPWTLRPVTEADAAFLLQVYAGTRADELALTNWDAAQRDSFVRMQYQAQAAHYGRHWPDAEHTVIEAIVDGVRHDAGRLWLHHRPDAIHILDIAIQGEWRGRGIGTLCLRRLMDQAEASRREVDIYVESGNPARRLYDRLGFQPIGEPDGVHQRMAWRSVLTKAMEICDEQA